MSKISGAESQIMEALWDRGPLTAEELVQSVGPAQGWGEATVKTLVNRLLKKGAIASRRADGRTLYAPLVARDEYVTAESQGLLDRLFGGELAPMVAHFARRRALSDEEKARLRRLLDELDRE